MDIGHKTWNQKRAPLYTAMKGDALEGALSTLFALMITLPCYFVEGDCPCC